MNEIRGNYKHLLFTRFNINSADTLSCRLDPAYLKVRFELFERYCLPSVQNQTNQNFIWLLLLDENTPNDYKDRIKLYQEKYGRITPIYLPTLIMMMHFIRIMSRMFRKLLWEQIHGERQLSVSCEDYNCMRNVMLLLGWNAFQIIL